MLLAATSHKLLSTAWLIDTYNTVTNINTYITICQNLLWRFQCLDIPRNKYRHSFKIDNRSCKIPLWKFLLHFCQPPVCFLQQLFTLHALELWQKLATSTASNETNTNNANIKSSCVHQWQDGLTGKIQIFISNFVSTGNTKQQISRLRKFKYN